MPRPLVDASGFVDGGFVGDELGWFLVRSGARSERVAWPRVPADHLASSPCVKLEVHESEAALGGAVMAWPIAGSERLLILADEPLIAEVPRERPGCLVGVPARPRGGERGRKTVEVLGHEPRIALFLADAPAPSLFGLTIVERDGRVPLLELAGGELEPVGIEIEETDQLGCVSPEDAREHEIDVAPARHSVSMVWRGSDQTEELELVLNQRCIGDPSQQGGEVEYERELVWVLERDDTKVGWRQVSARLSSSQSSSGDGVSQSELQRQSVYTWRAGPVGLVGRRVVVGLGSNSNWGSRSLDSVSHDWWLVPTSALDIGLDEGIFDEAGLRLSPRPVADDRQAYARYTMGERRLTGSCALSLGSTEVRVSCGNEVLGAKMGDAMGETERFAEVWDLGAALLLKLGIARDHRYTEPLSEEDPTPVERVDQEDARMTLLLSKRDGTLIQLSRSSSSGSM